MKRIWHILLFCPLMVLHGQYVFKGQVPERFKHQEVSLSLIEDYRKSSRVYFDQIIQKTQVDSLGFFLFEGDNLNSHNRIYRIHVDGCNGEGASKSHFLKECNESESILFIAKNTDTVSLPLDSFNQSFCDVVSTNASSIMLLEIEDLKEQMFLDFVENESETSMRLNLEKWFERWQDFGKQTNEPLAELYTYAFLSDRASETREHYLGDLPINAYYTELSDRLSKKYPSAAFTAQYQGELKADQSYYDAQKAYSSNLEPVYLYYVLGTLGIVLSIIFITKKKRGKKKNDAKLTQQERRIFDAILLGKTNKEIASELFISVSTVKTHINSLYKKMGVSSRTELRSRA
ncbi:response regulator transcription factor [Allomuricauda sp. SCSIO 65647]|uniref:response regulator transcription factor n=1 Tax=Allomuricauda sp. SCSIO 65647 TaxID=2908843 RepID=UPI001F47BFCD|nr:response regulator transcription factor [Muricauda sp. SCSIO 65647]UJH66469.1 response regulator transcription factor [Muricauda sp. SCSIO 65647]